MAIEVDDRQPGMGLALLTVLGMILTIAVLSVLIWALMIGVTSTTAGRHEQGTTPRPADMTLEQKALPAKP